MWSFLKREKDLCYLLALAGCFLVVIFLTSCYTSPLYPDYYGYDSAIFSLLGKGITEGKNLYTELFDHKGPMIFFINALGFSLGGHLGIWGLQCLFGLVSLFLLYYTGKMLRRTESYTSLWECLLIFIAGYAVFFYTFQRGNLTEEYSLPFISCALFLLVKYALHTEKDPLHPPVYSVLYGICLAYLAFLRLNNSVTICAGILAVAIYLIYKKEYQNLLWNLLFGIMGILLIAVPVLVYFHQNNSLEEMIYATFLHNFQIAGNTAHISLGENPAIFFILYLPIVVSAILLFCEIKKNARSHL